MWSAYKHFGLGRPGQEGFDPSRNAETDIAAAVAEARGSGRRVLIVVGNSGCPWCARLDKFAG